MLVHGSFRSTLSPFARLTVTHYYEVQPYGTPMEGQNSHANVQPVKAKESEILGQKITVGRVPMYERSIECRNYKARHS